MSKSWIVMSRKIPPETRMYSIGGGAGSRLVMRTRWGAPTRPAAAASRTYASAGAKPGSERVPGRGPAPRAARDPLAHRRVRGSEPAVEADLERDARLLDRAQGAVDLRQVQRHGLLAEDRLAGAGRRHDQVGVRVGARADRHGVHVG